MKEEQIDVDGEISGSEDEDYLENNDKSTDYNTEKSCPADGTQFTERISVPLVGSILQRAAGVVDRPSTRKKFNRAKTKFSTKYIEQLVHHTIRRCKLRKSEFQDSFLRTAIIQISLIQKFERS